MKSKRITNQDYSRLKSKLLTVQIFFSAESDIPQEKKKEMIAKIFETPHSNTPTLSWIAMFKSWGNNITDYEQKARKKSAELDEALFLQSLSNAEQYGGDFVTSYISRARELASLSLIQDFPRQCTRLHHKFQALRLTALNKQIDAIVAGKRETLYTKWRADFLQGLHEIQGEEAAGTPVRCVSCWHAFLC